MGSSRVDKIKVNVKTSLYLRAISIIVAFCSRIIFVRVLGADYLGVYGLFANVLGVLSLAEMGIYTTLMYSLYKPLADNDKDKIRAIIQYFKKLYLIIAVTITVLGLLILPFIDKIINLDKNLPNMKLCYVILLCDSVVSYLYAYREALLNADEKQYVKNIYNIIFQVIIFIGKTIVLFATKNYVLYLATEVIILFISNLVKNRAVLRLYPYLTDEKSSSKLDKEEKKKIFINLKASFFYKFGTIIQDNTDNILISIYAGTVVVGYYSNYTTFIMHLNTVIAMLFASITASIGHMIASKETSSKQEYFVFEVMDRISFFIVAFSSICMMCLVPDCIRICFGEEYVLGIKPLLLAVVGFYTNEIRQSIWVYRETTGLFDKTKYITLVTALLNIGFSIILGRHYGLYGILFATILSRMLYAWWAEPRILYKSYFKKSVSNYYIRYIQNVIICVIIGFINIKICSFIGFENIYIKFLLKIIVCITITILSFILIFYRTKEFKYIYEKLVKRVHKKIKMKL